MMLVTTFVAKYPFWSQGSWYPVWLNPTVRTRSSKPNHQLSFAGHAIGAGDQGLEQVEHQQDHHGLGTEVVQPADEPSPSHMTFSM